MNKYLRILNNININFFFIVCICIFLFVFTTSNLILTSEIFTEFHSNGFWDFAPDAKKYHNSAISINELITNKLFNFSYFFLFDRNHANVKWISLVYYLSGVNKPYIFGIFNLALFSLSIYLIYNSTLKITNHKIISMLSSISLFVPSILVNFISIMRDPFIIFGFCLFIFSIINIFSDKFKFKYYLILILSIYFIDETRSYLTIFFSIFLILCPLVLFFSKKIRFDKFIINFCLLILIILFNNILSFYLNFHSYQNFLFSHYQYECVLRNMKLNEEILYDDYKMNKPIFNKYVEYCSISKNDQTRVSDEIKDLQKVRKDSISKHKKKQIVSVIGEEKPTFNLKSNLTTHKDNALITHDQVDSMKNVILQGKVNSFLKKINDTRQGFYYTQEEIENVTYLNFKDFFSDLPKILFNGFFSPSIKDIYYKQDINLLAKIAIIENSVFIILVVFSLYYISKFKNLDIFYLIVIFCFFVLTLFSVFIPVQGTLMRLKGPFLIPIIISSLISINSIILKK